MAPLKKNNSVDEKRRGPRGAGQFMNQNEVTPAAATLTGKQCFR
jgi:hypothetical protein